MNPSTTETCNQWGHTSAPQINDPSCDCRMCSRHRNALANLKVKKKKRR